MVMMPFRFGRLEKCYLLSRVTVNDNISVNVLNGKWNINTFSLSFSCASFVMNNGCVKPNIWIKLNEFLHLFPWFESNMFLVSRMNNCCLTEFDECEPHSAKITGSMHAKTVMERYYVHFVCYFSSNLHSKHQHHHCIK